MNDTFSTHTLVLPCHNKTTCFCILYNVELDQFQSTATLPTSAKDHDAAKDECLDPGLEQIYGDVKQVNGVPILPLCIIYQHRHPLLDMCMLEMYQS